MSLAAESHPFLDGWPKQLFIGGEWVDSLSGETFASINPSTGKPLTQVALGSAADIDRAVEAGRVALNGPWSQFKPFDRQALLLAIADRVEQQFEQLAAIETLDMGAPVARTSLFKRFLLQSLRFYASQAVGIRGETIQNSFPGDLMSYTLRHPIGVVGGIIPWNGPLLSQLWSIGPTLATGCTLVLKPAEDAPLSALLLARIMQEAGLPAGVVNVVPGYGSDAGARLAAHPDVDKIAFTGSTVTGRKIIEASAVNMKRVSVELGGKSADIVFADADLDKAVPGTAMACFNNTGQICYAGTRLLVQRPIHDVFVQRLAEFAKTLRVGLSADPQTQLGPIVSRKQLDTVLSYVDIARSEGAEVVAGGERLGGELADGFFVPPTIVANAANTMRVAREEIFGPVVSVIPFDTEAEAVAIANDTNYGLGGAVWTRDLATAHRVSRSVRTGMMWVNCYGATEPAVPSEGTRMSGYGAKGGGRHIDEYLTSKTVWIKLD